MFVDDCMMYHGDCMLLVVDGCCCLLDFAVVDVCVLVSFLVLVAVVVVSDFKQQ